MTTKNNPISIGGAVSSALRCVRADVKQFCAVLAVALLAASSAAGAGETRPDAKAVTSAPAPQVKLLEAGAETRKKLRLHPKLGDKQTVDMTFKIAMDIQTGESASQPMKMPAMKMTTDVTIKGISSDGNITYEMVMTDVSVADDTNATPEIVEGMKSSLVGLKGLSGAGVMSDRGINQGIEMKAPPGASPSTRPGPGTGERNLFHHDGPPARRGGRSRRQMGVQAADQVARHDDRPNIRLPTGFL